ncbi:hypothetical protein SmJEL517_g03095 [Synchytrium microbalum]|uniref:Glycine cleavage system H protein n=1 Tax=Synchytrium microbalum TaxID=1806994 RepID=A0A507C814_9FUNG|nr:uncharacterized protein SmJEL517_g03095 [Synchytrium microbalum]TPX34164.1 hypothetical protein SmJEL517_g03095 [Synchytrium microbalum]
MSETAKTDFVQNAAITAITASPRRDLTINKMASRRAISLLWTPCLAQRNTLAMRPLSVAFSQQRFMATRKYTPDHEWVTISGDVATVGITDYAQKALGDVVYCELPGVGKVYAEKDQMGAVESVKAASDIYAPVSGTVVEANKALEKEPTLLNNSPYEEGWIAKIKISKPSEFDSLMDEKAYTAHCDEAH